MGLPKRSGWAWGWFWIWMGPAIGLGILAYRSPDWGVPVIDAWDTPSAIQFWELWALLIVAVFMHRCDVGQKAAGFLDFYRGGKRTEYEIEEGPLRGLLTVQSIRSALTLGVLLALLSGRARVLGEVAITPASVLGTPEVMFFVLAVGGLSGSALTTLAAIQSYDYALRFKWIDDKQRIRLEFVKKAHRLGVIGFYCLMWSLTTATALAGTPISLVATSTVFTVMWYYYYFPPFALKTRAEQVVCELPVTAAETPVRDSSLRTSLGKKEGEIVTLREQWIAVREGLDVLECLLPAWAKRDVIATREIGDKIVGRER